MSERKIQQRRIRAAHQIARESVARGDWAVAGAALATMNLAGKALSRIVARKRGK